MRGVDYSWARPGGKRIKDAGFEFVVRYVPYPGDGGKGLTLAEIADLRANDLAIGLVFESTAERHLDGFPAGQVDARRCETSVKLLDFPAELPIYFAVDFDAAPSQQAVIDQYQRGAADVLGADRVGVYGSFGVVERCHANGTARWIWQTYAWSGGSISAHNHLYQYLNGQDLNGAVDFNEAYGDDQGLWKAEEDMGMTPDEKAEMAMLRKIVGGPAANDFNLLQNINDLNAELTAHKANHAGGMPAGKFKANIEILKEGL